MGEDCLPLALGGGPFLVPGVLRAQCQVPYPLSRTFLASSAKEGLGKLGLQSACPAGQVCCSLSHLAPVLRACRLGMALL